MSEDRTQQLPDGDMKQVLALLGSINSRLDSMDARLTTLEDKVERRLHDTRPIWEQVLSRLTDIETRLTNVETRLTDIETRLTNVETRLDNVEKRLERVEGEVYDLGRKFRVFNADILKLQDRQEDLGERLRQIESEPTQK
jgi:chromosome segregation ATPase